MKRRLLLLYLALLVCSNAVRYLSDEAPPLDSGEQEFVTNEGRRVVYRLHEAAAPDATTVLLLHGSPGNLQDFDSLADALPQEYQILVPDLPGFGASWARLDDYSTKAHAEDVLQLLEHLEIDQVQVVGFSMGGGVALEMAHRQPQTIASLSMVGAIGVQELELFGSYGLNHAVHGGQLALIQAGTWLLPHFGKLDRFPLNVAYARNFFDTDQRPFREYLQEFTAPSMVVHGREDFLVPPEVATEHHRLLPQSELHWMDGSHFLLWTQPEEVAQLLSDFFSRVQQGEALTRADAPASAHARAAEAFDPKSVPPFTGPALLVAMLLLALATLVSEDLTCIATGLLVAQGRIGLFPGAMACFLGIFIGDMLLFLAGRKFGRAAIARRPFRWMITPGAVERASLWFRRRGPWVIFLSRFMPGLRLPTYFAAGVLRTRVLWFAFYFALAGLLWTPILVYLSSRIGASMEDLLDQANRFGPLGIIATLVFFGAVWKLLLPLATWRGRRDLVGRWRRARNWEYWPRWRVYGPLIPFLWRQARKSDGWRVVTAANPGIEGGGLAGESKTKLLQALDGPEIATFCALAEGGKERWPQISAWMEARAMNFPLVLKPDAGDRGFGVAIVHQEQEAEAWLEEHTRPAMAQEYISGLEFGVSWLRDPLASPADEGHIPSLARKEFPTVVGDGKHDLEHLILAHPRHVAQAASLLEANAARSFAVPEEHEVVTLSPLGTHSRGAAFFDAQEHITPELEQAIRRISGRLEGFHLGRFDLRVPSLQDLEAGRNLKVIELNGLTGEPAHMYDPKYSVREARQCLRELWTQAFQIGAGQHAAGAPLPTWRELWHWLQRSR